MEKRSFQAVEKRGISAKGKEEEMKSAKTYTYSYSMSPKEGPGREAQKVTSKISKLRVFIQMEERGIKIKRGLSAQRKKKYTSTAESICIRTIGSGTNTGKCFYEIGRKRNKKRGVASGVRSPEDLETSCHRGDAGIAGSLEFSIDPRKETQKKKKKKKKKTRKGVRMRLGDKHSVYLQQWKQWTAYTQQREEVTARGGVL